MGSIDEARLVARQEEGGTRHLFRLADAPLLGHQRCLRHIDAERLELLDFAQAMRRVARRVQRGEIAPHAITPETVAEHLATAGIPDPDLLIRTSGEMRVSNFYLWQIAYSELYVTDTFWPDFREREYYEALEYYQRRQRRYGRTAAQVERLRAAN